MSVARHRAQGPSQVACFVLTISDSRTADTDTSGRAIAEMLEAAGHVVAGRALVRDDPSPVAAIVREQLRGGAVRAIITTGGTGVARRDSTYDALAGLFDKRLDGFGELFRMISFQDIGSAAMLSRAACGIAGDCVIFVLPGAEAAVRLALERLILPELGHLIGELDT